MEHQYAILDVFTEERFAGNPLAVVFDADNFPTEFCQRIAREFNLSETVFVSRPRNEAHSAAVRIFTPVSELPFAGHPTVGTAILLARRRWPDGGSQDGLIVLEEQIGPVRVGVSLGGKRGDFAEFDIPKLPVSTSTDTDRETIAAVMGLQPKEIGFENHKPCAFSAGVPYVFVPVRDMATLRRCKISKPRYDELFGAEGQIYVYCRETVSQKNDFHARMFAPHIGIGEDPATGSAAAAFSAVIQTFDTPPAGTHNYRIEQGHIMGRPSIIHLEINSEGGKLRSVRIGGNAVLLASGIITV
ncbi:MAG: PhzF family phenazine biosynthesis protein [Rhodobiaceae bacterium]|nr:PhzF family phenazine biosynthesis protein [Rhodobiaceae bacterium]MCC0055720.1 PhzF family phenazine biosynthesis protein [Rhodobiaceae bacterium]